MQTRTVRSLSYRYRKELWRLRLTRTVILPSPLSQGVFSAAHARQTADQTSAILVKKKQLIVL